jgi:CobQ-like glutamine amidotransferase family enzyme
MTSGHRPKHAARPRQDSADAARGAPVNDGPASWATTTAQAEAAASMSGQSVPADRPAADRPAADRPAADRDAADPGAADRGAADRGGADAGAEAEPVTAQLDAVRTAPAASADGQFAGPAAWPAEAASADGQFAGAAAWPGEAEPAPASFATGQRGPSVQPGRVRPARRTDDMLRLVWVYPDLLSTYGDRGNLLVLERRAALRGIEVESYEVNADQQVPRQGDIYLMGGGEDLPQILAARRLRADGGLTAAVESGAVLLAVCAGYQIIGTEFGGVDGEPVPGLGILNMRSGRGERRGVGEIVADVDPDLDVPRLTGFENHQGVTSLGPGVRPLARVVLGVGNGDGTEGAYAGKVLGTYLHGPALVRNPGLADLLLTWAAGPLEPLDSADESWARQLREERLAAVS